MDDNKINPDETWQSSVSRYIDEAGLTGVLRIFSEAIQPLVPAGEHITWLLRPIVDLRSILTPEPINRQDSPASRSQPQLLEKTDTDLRQNDNS